MKNLVIAAILLCLVAGIVYYLHRAKKRGQGCVGCPCSKQCGGKCSGSCHDAKRS